MSLSIKGTVKQKLELEQGTSKAGNEWKSQSFVLNTGAQYNPDICFKLFGEDKIQILSNINEGEEIEVFSTSLQENGMENGLPLQTLGKLKNQKMITQLKLLMTLKYLYLKIIKQKTIYHFKCPFLKSLRMFLGRYYPLLFL